MGIWTDLVFRHTALCKQLLNVLDSPSVNATDQLGVPCSSAKGNNILHPISWNNCTCSNKIGIYRNIYFKLLLKLLKYIWSSLFYPCKPVQIDVLWPLRLYNSENAEGSCTKKRQSVKPHLKSLLKTLNKSAVMRLHTHITAELCNALIKISSCTYNKLNGGIWPLCIHVPNKSKLRRTRLIEGDTEIESHCGILKCDPILHSKFQL